jgi:hypothetical protein
MYLVRVSWPDVVLWSWVVGLVVFLAFLPGAFVRKCRETFARRTEAYIDPAFIVAFDRDTRRMARLGAVLVLVMVTAMQASFRLTETSRITFANPVLLEIPLFGLALAVFAAVRLRAAGREFRVREAQRAVARARRVVLSDYVGRPRQALTWCAVVLCVGLAATVVVFWRLGEEDGALALVAVAGAGLTLAMAAFTLWFGRVLCQRPTPAVDASHLYLQDARRATALTWAHGTVCYTAYQLAFGLALSGAGPRWFGTELQLAMLLALAIGIAFIATQRRQFRRRLWSTLLPGQVLLPGQQLPPPAGVGA